MGALLPLTGQPYSRRIYHWPTQSVWRATVIDLGRPDRITPPPAAPSPSDGPTGMIARNVYEYMLENGPQTTGQLARQLAWVWEDGKDPFVIQGIIQRAMTPRGGGSDWFVQLGRVQSIYNAKRYAMLWGIRGLHGDPEQ